MTAILTLTMNPAIDHSSSVDIVADEKKLKCTHSRFDPGGGGINVSRAIHILGGQSIAMYPSGGLSGQMLQQLLQRENITHHPIPIQQHTRINHNVIEESTGRQYRFNMPGALLQDHEWEHCLDVIKNFRPSPLYIVASGSLPPGVPDDFYAQVARIAKDKGARFLLDTSKRGLQLALDEGVFLVKPNLGEFNEILGEQFTDEEHILTKGKELINQGNVDVLVISLGRSGAFVLEKDSIRHLTTPIVPIRSAVGAGDSMLAGITFKLSRGSSIQEAVLYGVAAGAAAVMTPGSALCRKEDTDHLFQKMKENSCAILFIQK